MKWTYVLGNFVFILALAACSSPALEAQTSSSPVSEQIATVSTATTITGNGTATAITAATPTAAGTPTGTTTPAYPTPHPNPQCEALKLPVATNLPPVTEQDWSLGRADAPVTVIEYADFQCPACAGVSSSIKQLLEAEKDKVRLVYRHFPLTSIHDKAMITAEAAEAAGAQGKFWEMHALLYERQRLWSPKSVDEMPSILSGYAQELGLDAAQFNQALAQHTYRAKVQQQYDDAIALGLPGTPSFIFNDVHYPADQLGFSDLAFKFFLYIVAFRDPPPQVIQVDKRYQATIETEKGNIVIELFADRTPLTVNNFVYLARQGWYDNTTFHRVIPGFVAQGGDPTATGSGMPGYRCSDELTPQLRFDAAGVVGMANSGPNTNGAQFFITLDPQPALDGRYPVFGRVVSGMDVVRSLSERDPQKATSDQPGDRILRITIQEL
ncbi:MAG: peptidylprolyl isomerase [Anaerolineae bacterium]|nr:peptidylprolyl isomerase [Anaerolineae bacterium]MDW8071201.1 peptidylprolyl isomerase [Anaerolineae bacterium]